MPGNPTVVTEPFEEIEEIETHDGGRTVRVGDRYHVMRRYGLERLPAEVVKIYMKPRGFSGGKFDRGADGHVCTPTISVEFDVPEGHEYDHLDGKRRRTENYNADYVLGFRRPAHEHARLRRRYEEARAED